MSVCSSNQLGAMLLPWSTHESVLLHCSTVEQTANLPSPACGIRHASIVSHAHSLVSWPLVLTQDLVGVAVSMPALLLDKDC